VTDDNKIDEEEVQRIAAEMAHLINKNINEVVQTLSVNMDMKKKHTVLAAFAGVFAVSSYFEYKLTELSMPPAAVQKAKEKAEKYVVDVISQDLGAFPIDGGKA